MSLIVLDKITKTFSQGYQETKVLQEVSLNINEGDFCAIMGASGSGKSTLMYILGCLDTPSSGNFILDGRNINALNDNELSQLRSEHIGFVFQAFYLVPYLSVLDNVLLPTMYARSREPYDVRQKGLELLEQLGMADRANFNPEQLSGGQKQRVAIARALINNPKILLADEPTGQLDSASGDAVLEIFNRLHHEGKTIILVTHDEKTASYAKRHIILQDGKII